MTAKKYLAAAVFAALAVNAANAAEKIKVGVGGDLQSVFSTQFVQSRPNGDDTNKKIDHTNVRQDAYIRFGADTVLDNGLKVGAKAEFEALATDGTTFAPQEVYLTVGGKFGDVYLGRARSAAGQSHVYLPSAGVPGLGVDDANISIFGNTSNTFLSTDKAVSKFVNVNTPADAAQRSAALDNHAATDVTTDASRSVTGEFASRVAYYTPRLEGLRFGVSYTPNGNTNSMHTSGYSSRKDSGIANGETSLGANYNRKMGPVAVDASAGYTFAKGAPIGYDVNGVSADKFETHSPKAYQAGLALGFKGFTLGTAYSQTSYSLGSAPYDAKETHFNEKQRTYGAGLKYETGPWAFGVSGLQQQYTQRTTGVSVSTENNRTRLYEAGVSYILGPGVTTGAGVYYNENHAKNSTNTATQDGIAGAVGLGLSF